MSNFPIIPTTPPPLEGNESEDEEEPEYRTFNDVNQEKDIDFVIPDFTTDNELEAKTSTHLNDKTTYEDKQKCEQIDDKFVEQNDINFCDNLFDNKILSEKDSETIGSDLELNESTVDSNENNLESNQNHLSSVLIDDIIEKSIETEVNVTEEFSDFNGVNTDDNDFDFADFTSYRTTEVIENVKQNKEVLNESQSSHLNNFDNSFGDFNESFPTNFDAINVTQNNENPLNNNNESDDEFADFASAEPVVSTEFESVSSFKSNTNKLETDENDDGFADFASFQDNLDNSFVDNTTLHSNSSVNERENLTKLFAQVFPNTQPIDSVDNSPNISRDLFNTADQNSKSLWKHLQDLESAPSLKLKWSASHSFQLLLAALNIDPRNILRNPSVPMFASGLGCVLEPTKPKFNDDLSDDLETESSNGLIPNSIPPVHFDWSSSGLTNPLDSNQKTMVAFDLDFFVTNDDVKNTTKQTGISNFEEELLNNQIENSCDSHIVHKNNLMEQILSSVANTSSKSMPKTNGSQVLSAEALQVLDELPNLSFLTAKVLMFPINIKTNP